LPHIVRNLLATTLFEIIRGGHVRGGEELKQSRVCNEAFPRTFLVDTFKLWKILQEGPALQIETCRKSESLRDGREVLERRELIEQQENGDGRRDQRSVDQLPS